MLPADVLIADHHNNRLLIVDPQGRIRWEFPRPGDLAPGQTFLQPDDAFFSPDGKYIIATQEDDQVISVISLATSRIVYRYGVPGVPGAGPDHLFNPDDAMLTPAGIIIAADIKNCRIVIITPPAHTVTRVIGQTTNACEHDPPRRFGSPNGAFPMTNGHYLVTEINGDWADEMSLSGSPDPRSVRWSANPPGVLYPSDTNEVYPGRYLTADYSDPGQIVEFTSSGRLLWRMGGFNQPSLALPLPGRRHPAERRLQPPRVRGGPRDAPHRVAVRAHRGRRAGAGVPQRPRRGRPRAAGLAAGHARQRRWASHSPG